MKNIFREKKTTNNVYKKNIVEKVYDFIKSIENTIIEIIMAFVTAMVVLKNCASEEFLIISEKVVFLLMKIKKSFTTKIREYYSKNPHVLKKNVKMKVEQRKKIRLFKGKVKDVHENISSDMANMIVNLDVKNEQLADTSAKKIAVGQKRVNFFRRWAHYNTRRLLGSMAVIFVLMILCVTVYDTCSGYEYAYNGRVLGIVKRQEEVLKLMDLISEKLSKEYKAEIKIDKEKDITFNRIISVNKKVDNSEDILRKLTYMKNMSAKAYGIYIDNERVAILDTKESCENALKQVKNTFLMQSQQVKYERVELKEKVDIKKIQTKLGRIENSGDVIQKLLTGAVLQEVHTVQKGDTLSVIAQRYGISMSELIAANPDVNIQRLVIGQNIVLKKPAPMLTLKTVEIAEYMESIPYEITYEDNGSMYKNEKKVKVKGENGSRSVVARIIRENGIQVEAKILSSTEISKPITEVIIKGTKELPPLKGTGVLRVPVSRYKMTSRFGRRWGGFHSGIDLAAPTGTRIGAADGGVVTSAGYRGPYGYCVEINHGGGVSTLYAHCSKLHVSKGQRVYQNQHIANVGSTGNSTGSHCHFEVRINGTPRNPLNYL